MNLVYITAGVLYAAMWSFCIWVLTRDGSFRDWLHYYRRDDVRGTGYFGLNNEWVAQKIIWREAGYFGLVAVFVLLAPIIVICVLLWEGWIDRVLKAVLPVGRKEAVETRPAPKRPRVDREKLGQELLGVLQQCTSRVVIAGPSYNDKHFQGDVICDAASLLPWAEHHATAVISSMDAEQAARMVLPQWLKGADLSDPTPSFVTQPFIDVLRPYAEYFVTKRIAKVLCPQCRQLYGDVAMKDVNPRSDGVFEWITLEWYCPSGHQLRKEDFGFRPFCRSRSGTDRAIAVGKGNCR